MLSRMTRDAVADPTARAEDRPTVVLVRTQEQGNLGSTARAMANMGLSKLILVAPREPIGPTARAFAVGAGHVLDGARLVDDLESALAPFQRVVGTTSTRGRTIDAPPISPRELPPVLADDPPYTSTALVFGPEASGLKLEELSLCSPLVRIPCSPVQPTLNLAQAVLILSWELAMASRAEPADSAARSTVRPELAAAHEIEGLFDQLRPLLAEVGFDRDGSFESVMRDLRSLAARASLTEREVRILRGICRRTRGALDHR